MQSNNTLNPLSTLEEWQLEHSDQDIRGMHLYDQPGHSIGIIEEMLVDKDSEHVTHLRLDNGQTIPTKDVAISGDLVFLKAMNFKTPMVKVYGLES